MYNMMIKIFVPRIVDSLTDILSVDTKDCDFFLSSI